MYNYFKLQQQKDFLENSYVKYWLATYFFVRKNLDYVPAKNCNCDAEYWTKKNFCHSQRIVSNMII